MRDIPKDDIKRRELSYKASKDVLKNVGLLPAPVQSQTLINIQNNQSALLPVIQELLTRSAEKAIDDDELIINVDDL